MTVIDPLSGIAFALFVLPWALLLTTARRNAALARDLANERAVRAAVVRAYCHPSNPTHERIAPP